MFVFIQKQNQKINSIVNDLGDFIPRTKKEDYFLAEYTLTTFGKYHWRSYDIYYISEDYDNTKTVYLWYHLLQPNKMFSSDSFLDIPKDRFVKYFQH